MSRTSAILPALLLLTMLASCGKHEAGNAEQLPQVGNADAPREAALPSPYAFEVDVVLSDAARERLAESKESVIVAAMYYAGGKAGIPEGVLNDVGLVDIGRAQIEIAGEGRAAFDGSAVLRERLDLIEGDLQLNVNVFSGRQSSPDNLLDCDVFQGAVLVAAAQPVSITCRLISGE